CLGWLPKTRCDHVTRYSQIFITIARLCLMSECSLEFVGAMCKRYPVCNEKELDMKSRGLWAIVLVIVLAIPVTLLMFSSSATLNTDPEENFEYIWTSFDRMYGQFENKKVDWDALYHTYRPQVTAETSEDELFDIVSNMLAHLNDGHVWLFSEDRQFCAAASANDPVVQDFSPELVDSTYLQGRAQTKLEGLYAYGWLADNIGYIRIRDFMAPEADMLAAIDEILVELGDAQSIVVDIRDNPGGKGRTANRVADRFADQKRHFMSSALRYGPEHSDTLPMHFHVQPRGKHQFTGTTILLTNRGSASAAERFTLAMRVLPHVTIVGSATAGMFSVKFRIKIPNGWATEIAYKSSFDHTGVSWDAIGVPPDITHANTEEQITAGVDNVLELATTMLRNGPPELQDESASLIHIRTSLVELYFDTLATSGVDAATKALHEARSGDPDTYFFDMKLGLELADPFVFRKESHLVIPLLECAMDMYPQVAMTYDLLSAAYINNDQIEEARQIIQTGKSVERMFPWEGDLFDRVEQAIQDYDERVAAEQS
ncbi:MAG: S41 family peptidase, partial [Xanthomonadales bacterium]|nr:S41 family peptidase [Xanthomonadales bacterium]